MSKIAIYGVLDRQRSHILRRCRKHAKRLVFHERQNRHPGRADHAVVWAKFNTHAVTEQAKRLLPPSRVHIHHGGLAGLCQVIDRVAKGE